MFLIYIKLALRLMARNPFFTFLNVAGLSVGFAASHILWQYSQAELHSDSFHKDSERIVRLIAETTTPDGETFQHNYLHPAFARAAGEKLADVEDYTRVITQNYFDKPAPMDHEDFVQFTNPANGRKRSFIENNVIYGDENLFQFFNFPLLKGEPEIVLRDRASVVLSEGTAKKYFGNEDPIGAVIYLNDSIPFTVSGVFASLPGNTHLSFDIVLPMNRIEADIEKMFPMQLNTQIYLKYRSEVEAALFEANLSSFLLTEFKELFQKYVPDRSSRFWLLPLHELPFAAHVPTPKSKFYLVALSVVALIILGMAWINYVNLSVAVNRRRLKEMAARMIVGARSVNLFTQFITEAATMNVIACLLAFTLIQLTVQPIEAIFDFHVPDWNAIGLQGVLFVAVALFASILITGLYPALLVVRRSPSYILRAHRMPGMGLGVNNILLASQYCSAIVLIVWISAVFAQLNHIVNANIGIKTDQVIVVDLPANEKTVDQNLGEFESKIQKIHSVRDLTVSSTVAGDGYLAVAMRRSKGVSQLAMDTNGGVDERFIPFYGVKLLAGRNFRPDQPSDRKAIIISVNGSKRLGFENPLDALGQKVLVEYKSWSLDDMEPVEVIGIIEDYNRKPLYETHKRVNSEGTALTYRNHLVQYHRPGKVSLLVAPDDYTTTIDEVQRAYSESFPGSAFNWYSLNENINKHYQSQQVIRNQILFFSVLAIGIACLGLLGMISNKVVEKTKEIGIRKVLGAKLHQVAQLLLKTTMRQVIVAAFIGVPAAYYVAQQYLLRFTERVELQWWHFALPVAILVTMMFGTIASVLWSAARGNPVDALKHE